MTHSYRHTPITGISLAKSEATDKKIWHQRFRTRTRQRLKTCTDYHNYVDVNLREISNPWQMAKDGKQWLNVKRRERLKKYLRK